MESTDSNNEVKTWLMSNVGKMIDVVINQKLPEENSDQIVWKGRGKVLRCVRDGVVLELKAGGASWWSRIFGSWGVKYVVSRWTQRPFSVPYRDLKIDLDPITRTKRLVIDADYLETVAGRIDRGRDAEGKSSRVNGN